MTTKLKTPTKEQVLKSNKKINRALKTLYSAFFRQNKSLKIWQVIAIIEAIILIITLTT